MYKRNAKSVFAGCMAAVMALPAAVHGLIPMHAFAGEILGETSFDFKSIPWHTVESYPARQRFDISDGALHIYIIEPQGYMKENLDLQLQYNNLEFRKDHVYEVSFQAKTYRNDMELCSYIGDCGEPYNQYCALKPEGFVNGPHMGGGSQGWRQPVRLTTEWQTWKGTFECQEDLRHVTWSFQYAMDTKGYGGDARAGDEIWFDNLSIVCKTCDDVGYKGEKCDYDGCFRTTSRYYSLSEHGGSDTFISVNQLGYYPQLAKIAAFSDNQGDVSGKYNPGPDYGLTLDLTESSYDYEIVDFDTEEVVYTGKTEAPVQDTGSGDTVYRIDFTDFQKSGRYRIRIRYKGKEWHSLPFRIADDIYQEKDHDLLTNALNYFYLNRSGLTLDAQYITSGDKNSLAHKGGHKTDKAYVQTEWTEDYSQKDDAKETYASSQITANGGWYGGLDYGKYMVSGGISVWTLQNMYERAIQTEAGKRKFADNSGTVVIPENGNGCPDILDECRYELEFMSQMKVQADEPAWGKYAGLYYHKLQDHKPVGLAVRPWNYHDEWETVRVVKPPTFAATLNYAASAAQAARLWAPYDSEYAESLRQSAKDAYQAYKKYYYVPRSEEEEERKKDSLYAPKYQGRTGEAYGDFDVTDDAYWAACELFITAKETDDPEADFYYQELSGFRNAFQIQSVCSGGENQYGGSFTMLNWGDMSSAGTLSLALHSDLLTDAQYRTLKDSVLEAADAFIAAEKEQAYGSAYMFKRYYFDPWGEIRHWCNGYEYGSNAMAVYNMMAIAYAYDLTGDGNYMKGVTAGMDYLFGNNPLSFSYVTGYGSYKAEQPCHKYWGYAIDDTLPAAPDGVLVGGPNSSSLDDFMRGAGFKENELFESESRLSQRMYLDWYEAESVNGTAPEWNAPFAWLVSFLQDEAPDAPSPDPDPAPDDTVWGDINCDSAVDVSDAVLLSRYLIADSTANVTDQGLKNANVIRGDLDADDISAILMCIAKKILPAQFPLDKLPTVKS